MKRNSIAMGLLVLAVWGLGPIDRGRGQDAPAPAAEDAAATFGRLASDQELWSGPGASYRVVAKAAAGSLVEVIGETGEYYRVRVPQGFLCYIHSNYIVVDEEQRGRVVGDAVNLRSVPSTEWDYPLCKVNSGDTLLVWEREGEWIKVSAPAAAHAYVLKAAVVAVAESPEILQERAQAAEQARQAWADHAKSARSEEAAARSEEGRSLQFGALERLAEGGFAGQSLEEMRRGYEEIAAQTSDQLAKKIAEARVREIDALMSSRQMEEALDQQQQDMRQREEHWRAEFEKLRAAYQSGAGASAGPGGLPSAGRLLTVLGRVDASGTNILLRGGRTQDNPLYAIVCPDERFVLADFHGRRIAVRGRVAKMTAGELPEVAVERIEILR